MNPVRVWCLRVRNPVTGPMWCPPRQARYQDRRSALSPRGAACRHGPGLGRSAERRRTVGAVFAVRDATLDEMAQQVPLVRFGRLTLLMVSEVIAPVLQFEPTAPHPRHYTVSFEDLDDGLARLAHCQQRIVPNPYHDA